MSKEITDKTWGLATRSFGIIWLTESQAKLVQEAIKRQLEYIELVGVTVMKGDIAGLATGDRLKSVERTRRGDWECDHGHWHTRGEQCGHGLMPERTRITG